MNKQSIINNIAKKYCQTYHSDMVCSYIEQEIASANSQYDTDIKLTDVFEAEVYEADWRN